MNTFGFIGSFSENLRSISSARSSAWSAPISSLRATRAATMMLSGPICKPGPRLVVATRLGGTWSAGLIPVLVPALLQPPGHFRACSFQVSAQSQQYVRGYAVAYRGP